MQEAYCRTWKYLTEGHQIDNIRAFVYRTAHNIIIDMAKKRASVSLDYLMEKGFTASVNPALGHQAYFAGQEML